MTLSVGFPHEVSVHRIWKCYFCSAYTRKKINASVSMISVQCSFSYWAVFMLRWLCCNIIPARVSRVSIPRHIREDPQGILGKHRELGAQKCHIPGRSASEQSSSSGTKQQLYFIPSRSVSRNSKFLGWMVYFPAFAASSWRCNLWANSSTSRSSRTAGVENVSWHFFLIVPPWKPVTSSSYQVIRYLLSKLPAHIIPKNQEVGSFPSSAEH